MRDLSQREVEYFPEVTQLKIEELGFMLIFEQLLTLSTFNMLCSPSRRRRWHPTPVLLSGKSHGQRSLAGLQSMGSRRVGHDWATSLSLFTFLHWRRNGNPLQCSCLENPRERGAWWAAVYGVAQSRTRLKRLSSSSSSALLLILYASIYYSRLFINKFIF